jgi:hypothetical protein
MHRRKVGFVPPFSVSPKELEAREMEEKAGESFREWTQKYLEPTHEEQR